ncbi:hypothetical protein JANAI61_05950 [Jannaschia sp. AI_61]|nr:MULTISPECIES: hypothetical protein [unclassified Jannaschia]GIT90137.1 hypothetical protein JANAI61_05950 [Jannaschia sp. AI_61]
MSLVCGVGEVCSDEVFWGLIFMSASVYEPDGAVLTEFFWSRGELDVIQGPIGSGTSSACCHRIWATAMEQWPDYDGVRRTRGVILRNSYRQLKKTTLKTWLDWFPENEWGDLVRSEPMTHHLVRPHPSGDGTVIDCEVIFLSVDGPETAEVEAASLELTWFWYNEGQFAEKEVTDEFLSRCGRYPSMKNGPGARWYGGIVDMNAPPEGHWVPYMRGDVALPEGMDEHERAEFEKPEGWNFFVQPPALIEARVEGKTVYRENPAAENQKHLRKTYLEQIRGKKRSWINARILNKTSLEHSGAAVYPTYFEADHYRNAHLIAVEGVPLIVGLDFGRDPAAVIMQLVGAGWRAVGEVIGRNESAERFAPRVSREIASKFPGFRVDAYYGDPRGADGQQATETTAYDVFNRHGMFVVPATTDNNRVLRESAMEAVLDRRGGLLIGSQCPVLHAGMDGGYHYPKIKGRPGMVAPKPLKNRYSHVVEALENALIGGGEGANVTQNKSRPRQVAAKVKRAKVSLRRKF